MRMAVKAAFWVAILCIVTGEVPDNKGLVSTAR